MAEENSNDKTYFILIFVLVLALGASVYTEGFSNLSIFGDSSPREATQDELEDARGEAANFIGSTLLPNTDEFEIKEIESEGDLYKLSVDVGGQVYTSYMKRDFSQFFPSALDMNDVAGPETENQEPQAETPEIPKTDDPTVQLFTMSYCPYGNQAEDVMYPVVELLGEYVEVQPHYIFYENYQGGGPEYCLDEESNYCAMHGINEANQNIRELCVYNNQTDKYWDFVANANEMCTVDDIETCWRDAAQEADVITTSVETCFNQNTLSYAEEEKALTDELEVSDSPTLIINGVRYQGSRSAEGYKTAICEAFNNPPQECEQTLGDVDNAQDPGSC